MATVNGLVISGKAAGMAIFTLKLRAAECGTEALKAIEGGDEWLSGFSARRAAGYAIYAMEIDEAPHVYEAKVTE